MSSSTAIVAHTGGRGLKAKKSWGKAKRGKSLSARVAQLQRKLNKVAREDAPESKAFYFNATGITTTTYSSSSFMSMLSSITQADTISGRVGAKCRAKQLRCRWSIFGQDLVGGHGSLNLRLLVVQYDDPTSSSVRYCGEFLSNTGNGYSLTAPPAFYSPLNFKVLVDEVVNVSSDYFGDQNSQVFVERTVPLNSMLVFDSNSTIVPVAGAIAMGVCSDDSTLGLAPVSYNFSSELIFTDA